MTGSGVVRMRWSCWRRAEDDLTHTLVVFVILDADGPLHTAELFVGEVRHEATAERAVGDKDDFVVGRQYLGVEEAGRP